MSVISYYPSAWQGVLALALVALGLGACFWVQRPWLIFKAAAVVMLIGMGGYLAVSTLIRPAQELAIGPAGVACKGGQAQWRQIASIEHRPGRRFGRRQAQMLIEHMRSDGRVVVLYCGIGLLAQGPRRFAWASAGEIEGRIREIGLPVNPALKLKNWP